MNVRAIQSAVSSSLFIVLLLLFSGKQTLPVESSPASHQIRALTYQQAPTPTLPAADVSPTAIAQPPLQPPINFTRQDYEAALAQWRAQGATEYEETVNHLAFNGFSGTWRLKVRVRNGRETVVHFEKTDGYPVPDWAKASDLSFMTVGSQLDSIGDILREYEAKGDLPTDLGFSFYTRVRFHPDLGYPTYFAISPNLPPGQMVFDADSSTEIESVQIVKRALPGMPSTGNPGP